MPILELSHAIGQQTSKPISQATCAFLKESQDQSGNMYSVSSSDIAVQEFAGSNEGVLAFALERMRVASQLGMAMSGVWKMKAEGRMWSPRLNVNR
jgi:hypothetical protein